MNNIQPHITQNHRRFYQQIFEDVRNNHFYDLSTVWTMYADPARSDRFLSRIELTNHYRSDQASAKLAQMNLTMKQPINT